MFREDEFRRSLVVESKEERDIWRQSWAPVCDISPIDPAKSPIADTADAYSIGGAVLTRLRNGPQIFQRSSRHVAETGDYVSVQLYNKAEIIREFESGPIKFGPNQIHITDYAHESRGIHFQGETFGLLLPRNAVGLSPDKARPAFSITPKSPIGRLLFPIFARLMKATADSQYSELSPYADRIALILKAYLQQDLSDETAIQAMRRSQLEAIRDFIETKLSDFEFQPEQIFVDFGISRSTLYRMFLPYGGVRKYIQERRTHRAVLDLATQPYCRGAISQAADRWGFSSESNFSRAVRQTFGVAPTSIVAAGQNVDPVHAVPVLLEDWLPMRAA